MKYTVNNSALHRRTFSVGLSLSLTVGLTLGILGQSALAQALSDRPIKLVVGAPAGGTADIIARLVGNAMSTSMGQPVVVDNKPGAGGAIAMDAMLSAPKDGLLFCCQLTPWSQNCLTPSSPNTIRSKTSNHWWNWREVVWS